MENISSGPSFSYTVFLDLDKTLVRDISGKILASEAFRKGMFRPSEIIMLSGWYLLYLSGLVRPSRMSELLVRWTRGTGISEFESICTGTAEKIMLKYIDDKIVEETGHHRFNGARIVILSASVCQVCNRIVELLEYDDAVCTSLAVSDDKLTGFTEGSLCYGEGKLKRLREYCHNNKINISESWYYGDSLSDTPVFLEVGHAVCVNPGRRLARMASEKKWTILRT